MHNRDITSNSLYRGRLESPFFAGSEVAYIRGISNDAIGRLSRQSLHLPRHLSRPRQCLNDSIIKVYMSEEIHFGRYSFIYEALSPRSCSR
jgi:hypothetical protein